MYVVAELGLYDGSSPPAWAYPTTSRMPTTTGGYCDWCLYDICDEMSTCTYGWKESTTPSYPDQGGSGGGNCVGCLYEYCDDFGKCEYGYVISPQRNPILIQSEILHFGCACVRACEEVRVCVRGCNRTVLRMPLQ
jgi:hypothetical protein